MSSPLELFQEARRRVEKSAIVRPNWNIVVPILKLNEEKRIAFGKASTVTDAAGLEIFDHQGHAIPVHELENAAYEYVLEYRAASNSHKPGTIGKGRLIESVVMTKEKREAMGLPAGPVFWWVGHKLDDDELWGLVKTGEYKELSIGGSGFLDDVLEAA